MLETFTYINADFPWFFATFQLHFWSDHRELSERLYLPYSSRAVGGLSWVDLRLRQSDCLV